MPQTTAVPTKRKRLSTSERLRRTAYHEAGHVVAGYALRRGMRSVTIKPDVEANFAGCVHNSQSPDFETHLSSNEGASERVIEREIIILLAGLAAGAKYSGRNAIEHVAAGPPSTARHWYSLNRKSFGDD